MNLNYIKEGPLQRLKKLIRDSSLEELKQIYSYDEPWLDDFFEDDSWCSSSRISAEKFTLKAPDENGLYDLTNSRMLFNALINLKPHQAVEERIWCYFTHVECWKYMRKRWPAEDYAESKRKLERGIIERYFMSSKTRRALIRNGVSRLWWFGFLSYEENSADPFQFTKVLLSRQDTAESLLGRNFSSSTKILKSALKAVKNFSEKNGDMPKRSAVREMCRRINYMGGVVVLDALSSDELVKRFEAVLDDLAG